MSRESSLWNWLAKARLDRSALSPVHMERIENGLSAGTPDVEGYLKLEDMEGQFWLELKAVERPARTGTPLRFKLRDREAQIEFMRRRWELGGNAFWLLQVGSGPERWIYLAPGPLGERLQSGLYEAALAVECIHTGIFTKRFSQLDILKKVISCRRKLSPTPS